MLTAEHWPMLCQHLSESLGQPFEFKHYSAMGGGCINQAYRLEGKAGQTYFVKFNQGRYEAMFTAEADGLQALAAAQVITVPQPHCYGVVGDMAFLVLDYLPLDGRGSASKMGEQLAALHRVTHDAFGWAQDNFIGTSPQPNGFKADWVTFWQTQRLGFQLRLAANNGYGGRLQREGERLQADLGGLFDTSPAASLLHGDLWGGNSAFADGKPVIFDPAVYYGDREADLAMTELFGGFGANFYHAYQNAYPLDAGYATRKTLYNLYHILNHLNLFGGGYLGQAETMISRLLSELR